MVQTNEFRSIFKRNRKKFDFEEAFEESLNEARSRGIEIFRERKEPVKRFKMQKGNFDIEFPDL